MDSLAIAFDILSQLVISEVEHTMSEQRLKMRQNLKVKETFHTDLAGRSFQRNCVAAGFSLLYIFLFLWLWYPWAAHAQQRCSSIEETFPVSAKLSEARTGSKYLHDPRAVCLSLRDALYYSLQGNQDIHISSYIPKQAREDLIDVQSVYDPSFFMSGSHDRILDFESDINDPTIEDETNFKVGIKKLLITGGTLSLFWETQRFDKTYDPFDFKSRYTSAPTFELKQPLLKNLGAKAEKAAIEIQNNNVNISEAEFQKTVNDIVAQVSRFYWKLFMCWEFVDISQKTLDMAEEVRRREVVRSAEGISKPLDVARARSVAEARRTEVLRSKERVRVVTDQLKFLLNWSDLKIDSNNGIIPVEVPRTKPVRVAEAEAFRNGLENRPEIKKERKNQDIAKVQRDLSRHQRLPKLDAFMNYGVNGYGRELTDAFDAIEFDDQNTWTVGLEFEVPIGNRSAKAIYRKQKLIHQRAGVAVQRVANQIKLEIKEAIHAIDLAKDEIQSTLLEMTEAENVVEGENERFELGQMTNEELLRAQEFLANARRNYIQAVVKYNIALSDLDRAQSILPYGLRIENKNDKDNYVVSMTKNKFLP